MVGAAQTVAVADPDAVYGPGGGWLGFSGDVLWHLEASAGLTVAF